MTNVVLTLHIGEEHIVMIGVVKVIYLVIVIETIATTQTVGAISYPLRKYLQGLISGVK